MQRIPWPVLSEEDGPQQPAQAMLKYYDTWVLNDQELPWLLDSDGTLLFHQTSRLSFVILSNHL